MQRPEIKGLDHWVAFLTQADILVLKQTARDLAALHEDQNRLSARSVAGVIAVDPMMTVKLLRYLQQNKRRARPAKSPWSNRRSS